ncbi:sensor histidine kinase [Marinospirillum insulare]|uniref:histidine kinase n=1 Tax=Marinospirillum insulare TaxID=217169 RepID=A0ABQ5ZWG5_9GAMM|nr:ATP-binding protein [Marinospirillum insulare]GLR63653.1 sensor histidine kinase [Marinospirillum insulare]
MAFSKAPWRNLLWLAAILILLLWPIHRFVESYYLEGLTRKNEQTLDLFVANLQGTLQRYEVLPQILGRLPSVQQALLNPTDPASLKTANTLLKNIQQQTGADVIYLMNTQGLTLAASNWDKERSFVNNSFDFRPYFSNALKYGQGEFFGLGNISFKRGYYFGGAVDANNQVQGVIVVKVDLDFTETLWGQTPEQLLVTDRNGVIILTSQPEWRFKATRELDPEEQLSIAEHQPYTSINPERITIKSPDWLKLNHLLPEIGWQVSIFTPRRLLSEPVNTAMAVVSASLLAILLIFGLLMQRKRHYLERIALDTQAKRELEDNVRTRTQDLQTLNSRLKQEVLERESTQQALVRTQDDLVQASKLSALGIMSASISHELNQPLAAIRSYTDNAKVLLDKQRLEETKNNLNLIASLTERMASIIEHLRAFARRDRYASEHVALQPAIDDTLNLVAKRQANLSIEIINTTPETTLWVEAGETRLRQILSNLVSNAFDALSESSQPRQLWLTTQVADGWVVLTLRDNAAGFTQEALEQAYEPFYTTKTSAKGLGLGLAICHSLTQALKGRLVLANHPEGGALVTLYLRQIPEANLLNSSEDSFK